jgi:hypothetical protein
MPKPTAEWTEDDVLSLPADENDTFERKGVPLLDLTLPQVREDNVLNELAKQLSAFANTGGGRIIYGLTNAGTVDNGGVARSIKGRQSTKEWLEDVIPTLTDYEIVGFNVYEIPPSATGSSLAPDKSIYVVDVSDSERAPHQSKRDLKYYVRLSGKSQPASHRIIEDIRNRTRYPKLEIHDLQITSAALDSTSPRVNGLLSEFRLNMNLSFGVRNTGKVRAANACLQLSATMPLSMSMGDNEYSLRPGAPGTSLLEIKNPLYPEMGIVLSCLVNVAAAVTICAQSTPLTLGGFPSSDVLLSITIFADSAPARKQEFRLSEIDPKQWLNRVVNQQAQHIRLAERQSGPPPRTGPWS